jgi:molybdopterin synthase sulfur carrier subunit
MVVRVRLFAAVRQLAHADSVEVELGGPPTVAGLRAALAAQFPPLAGLVKHAMFSVNAEYAAPDTVLSSRDEVACIPPVSGG